MVEHNLGGMSAAVGVEVFHALRRSRVNDPIRGGRYQSGDQAAYGVCIGVDLARLVFDFKIVLKQFQIPAH